MNEQVKPNLWIVSSLLGIGCYLMFFGIGNRALADRFYGGGLILFAAFAYLYPMGYSIAADPRWRLPPFGPRQKRLVPIAVLSILLIFLGRLLR